MTYNRYQNGKIYQITNNIDDMVYIGSTCLPLRKRWYNHKNEMNCGKGRHVLPMYIMSFRLFVIW